RTGSQMTSAPSLRNTSSKARVNLFIWIAQQERGLSSPSASCHASWRACCTQVAEGLVVSSCALPYPATARLRRQRWRTAVRLGQVWAPRTPTIQTIPTDNDGCHGACQGATSWAGDLPEDVGQHRVHGGRHPAAVDSGFAEPLRCNAL